MRMQNYTAMQEANYNLHSDIKNNVVIDGS